jgi:hypothetical protein
MIWTDGCEYRCAHWWYDSEDNDYQLTTTWKFEKNYPDMPDYWHLQDVEFDAGSARALANNHADEILSGCRNGGSVWCDIESQGPDLNQLEEVSYYE